MNAPRRPTFPEALFGLLVLWLAFLVHGPAGSALASALAPGGNPLLALLAGLTWLASGAVLLTSVLTAAWLLRLLWRRGRA